MKETEPSRRSLRAIPELDAKAMRRLPRGTYLAKAQRSFSVALLDPEIFEQFGSSEAINAALRALLEAAGAMKARPARARRPARKRAA